MREADVTTVVPERARKAMASVARIKTDLAKERKFPITIGEEFQIRSGFHLSYSDVAELLSTEAGQGYFAQDEALSRRFKAVMEDPYAVVFNKQKQRRNQGEEAVALLRRTYSLKSRALKAGYCRGEIETIDFERQMKSIIGVQMCLGAII